MLENSYAFLVLVTTIGLTATSANAQSGGDLHTGPIIENYGRHIDVPDAAFETRTDQVYKVAFELAEPLGKPDRVHFRLEAVARLVNMLAHAGVPRENIQVKLILHGGGTHAAMTNEAFRKRYDVDNPNLAMLDALADADVDIYLCEQSRVLNGLERSEVTPTAKPALSAMTTVLALQAEGYQFLRY